MLSLQNKPVDPKWGLVTATMGRTSLRSPSTTTWGAENVD